MSQYSGLPPILCFCPLLTAACLGVVVYAGDAHGSLDPLLHGREIFEQNRTIFFSSPPLTPLHKPLNP
jgi:hypothetical protein